MLLAVTSNKILLKINDQRLQLATNASPNVEFFKISFKNNQCPQSCHKVALTWGKIFEIAILKWNASKTSKVSCNTSNFARWTFFCVIPVCVIKSFNCCEHICTHKNKFNYINRYEILYFLFWKKKKQDRKNIFE